MKLIIVLVFASSIGSSYGQVNCNFELIIPLSHGITKFDATNILFATGQYKKLDETTRIMSNDYLKKDNKVVKQTVATFRVVSTICFNGDQKTIELKFANDKLYKITCSEIFPVEQFLNMKSELGRLTKILRAKFIYESEFRREIEGEQVGEGWNFRNMQQRSNPFQEVAIGYTLGKDKILLSGNEYYKLEIESYNLSNMPIDLRGF